MGDRVPVLRYVATFQCSGPLNAVAAGWRPWAVDRRVERDLRFFLPAARPIFEAGCPNARGVSHLVNDEDQVFLLELYLFPDNLGLMVLEARPDTYPWADLLRDPGAHLRAAADSGGLAIEVARRKLTPLVGELALHVRRLLTWTVWVTETDLSEREQRRLLHVLTEHLPSAARLEYRESALADLFATQGLELYTPWASLYHRDNGAALIVEPRVGAKPVERLVHVHGDDLFRVWLLELYLKHRLVAFMEDLVRKPPDTNRDGWYGKLHLDYLDLRNRFWFAELSANTTGRAARPRIDEALGLATLRADVEDEVAVLRERHGRDARETEQSREARFQKLIGYSTVFALPVTLVTGIFGMNLIVAADWLWAVLVGILLTMWGASWHFVRRTLRGPNRPG